MTKKQRKQIREQGRQAYLAGTLITEFDSLNLPQTKHTESLKGLYEMGWREAREETRTAKQKQNQTQ